MPRLRGIHGATTVKQDEVETILAAARELLLAIKHANPALHPQDIASILFTATPDLGGGLPSQSSPAAPAGTWCR